MISGTNYIPSSVVIQSASNTTTTPLGSSATFTGTAESNNYRSVACDIRTDAECTVFFDFSVDGTNWTTYPVNGFSCGPTSPVVRVAEKLGRSFRLRIVNGTSAQTYLRAYVYFGDLSPLDAALNQSISLDSGGLSTRPTIAQHEIIRGLRGGVTYVGKFGYRDVTSAAAGEQTLWADNSNLSIMTSADTFDIAYNSTTDGDSTTGALVLLIDYLDANFELQTATHVLGSTGTDTTSFSGLGINRVVVVSNGGAGYNTNDITLTDTAGATTQALVPATDAVTQQLVYHCPINSSPIVEHLRITTNKLPGSNPNVEFNLRSYNRFTETTYRVRRYIVDTQTTNEVRSNKPIAFSGRDVIYVTMDTDQNNTVVQGEMAINLYDTV